VFVSYLGFASKRGGQHPDRLVLEAKKCRNENSSQAWRPCCIIVPIMLVGCFRIFRHRKGCMPREVPVNL